MSTPAPATGQPQIIVVQSDGGSEKMNTLEKLQTLGVIAGLGVGGYLIYIYFIKEGGEGLCDDPIIGKDGLLGGIFPPELNPACAIQKVLDGLLGITRGIEGAVNQVVDKFAKMKPTGDAGVGIRLESCPAGWTDDGLTCREPITCASGLEFFSKGCSGGKVTGKLDNGGNCPEDHPDRIDAMCYKKCDAGYRHVAGMPYMCEPTT